LSNALKNEGEKPRWTAQDAYILIHKYVLSLDDRRSFTHVSFRRIDSLDVRHDSEIDWKTFPDPDWNLWSPHLLQRRWTTMKRSIKGHENMTHAGSSRFTSIQIPRVDLCTGPPLEILDVLREKKASHLPAYSIHSPKKKYKSDDIIEDEEEDESAQAGPSSCKKK
jgi:Myb-like DNA-binding protein REB1